MSREHGEHNEEVCDYLLNSAKYYDWVVTTAFYSALHYLRFELFPLNAEGRTFSTFEVYYNHIKKQQKVTKHKAMLDLTWSSRPDCYSFYKFLHDTCHTARYRDYKISKEIAEKSRNALGELKDKLTKTD